MVDNVENVLSYAQREAIVRGYASKAGFAAVPGLAAVRSRAPDSALVIARSQRVVRAR